jgi:alkaline phosphatase D
MSKFAFLERRRFLLGASGLGLFVGLNSVTRVWAAPKFNAYPFALGVAAGDPSPDGFVIWTRLAPAPLQEHGGMPMLAVPVRWQVAEDDGFSRIVRSGEELARPELGHSVHVELSGLRPARPYFYRFMVDGADASTVGTAKTAPAAGVDVSRVRLAVAGCQAYYQGWYGAYAFLAQEPDLDVVFHYGDYIYEGAAGRNKAAFPVWNAAGDLATERDHFGDELYTLDDYRRRYAQYKSDADLQAAHASAAFIMSFDDHEVDNDWGGEWDQDRTPPEVFALRKYVAMQAWYENLPVRRAHFPRLDGRARYFRRVDYGQLMRMHVLDTRSHRTNQLCNDELAPKCKYVPGQPSSILGMEQEAWLGEGLRNSARWNLLAQQVFVMPLKGRLSDGRDSPAFVDKWDGYPGARQRLAKTITDNGLTNVVIATGDAHMNAVGEIPLRDEERGGPTVATEFLATSISSNGDGGLFSPNVQRFLDADNPFLKLADNLRGYHVHDITPQIWRADVKVMDQVQRKGGKLTTRASFAVEPHTPKLHEA